MKECGNCNNLDDCTPCEKQLFVGSFICEDYMNDSYDCLEDGSEWIEFSYNKYTETILDYGEITDWDIFIVEKDY
jgi:hypothetical protein